MTERRRFNISERVGLFLASGGLCSLCGVELPPRWHADHVTPYCDGGPTDVLNGQATCPTCNLKKGASTIAMRNDIGQWPASRRLRPWQARAFEHFTQSNLRDYLIVATPGAGKTIAALKIGYELLLEGSVDRLIIVVPTDHLQRQWADAAAMVGINLTPGHRNGDGVAADVHGVVVTYAAVASSPMFLRSLCSKPALVILDEVHHVGDSLGWGKAVRQAFEPATFRLMLSGTPFRSDSNPIPFVTYNDAGRSVANFPYSYGHALGNGECRPVLFPSFEGKIEWIEKGASVSESGLLSEAASRDEASKLLEMALRPRGDWLRAILKEADTQLSAVRANGHPDAGGLVIAKDQYHARAIVALLRELTLPMLGPEPSIAVSDDPGASAVISAFAASQERWLVAVRMVSEGVDIPRLRVGVYATNIQTEMFFRQAVGRFVRSQPDLDEQSAYVYIPKIETLVRFAQDIKDERDHQIEETLERIKQDIKDSPEPCGCQGTTLLDNGPDVLTSTGWTDGGIVDGVSLDRNSVAYAADFKARNGVPSSIPDLTLAGILAKHSAELGMAPRPPAPTPDATQSTPSYQRKKKLADLARDKVARLATLTGQAHRDINARIKSLLMVPAPKESSEQQLLERIRLTDEWIEQAGRGR